MKYLKSIKMTRIMIKLYCYSKKKIKNKSKNRIKVKNEFLKRVSPL